MSSSSGGSRLFFRQYGDQFGTLWRKRPDLEGQALPRPDPAGRGISQFTYVPADETVWYHSEGPGHSPAIACEFHFQHALHYLAGWDNNHCHAIAVSDQCPAVPRAPVAHIRAINPRAADRLCHAIGPPVAGEPLKRDIPCRQVLVLQYGTHSYSHSLAPK